MSELIKSTKNNVSSISLLAKELAQKKEILTMELNVKNSEIKSLFDMPLNIDDFCSFIPNYVRNQANEYYSRLSYENKDKNNHGWGAYESESGEINAGRFFISGSGGSFIGDRGIDAFMRECFFHPENTIEKLTKEFKSQLTDSWGNNELPTIEERRVMVKNLVIQRDEIKEKINSVDLEIEEIRNALSDIKFPE